MQTKFLFVGGSSPGWKEIPYPNPPDFKAPLRNNGFPPSYEIYRARKFNVEGEIVTLYVSADMRLQDCFMELLTAYGKSKSVEGDAEEKVKLRASQIVYRICDLLEGEYQIHVSFGRYEWLIAKIKEILKQE